MHPDSSDIPHPTKIERLENRQLAIEWSDGQRRVYGLRELQDACPCANCREKRKAPPPLLAVIQPEEAQPLHLDSMRPVGGYAYSLQFNHGCNTGIYTFEFLRMLGREEPAAS